MNKRKGAYYALESIAASLLLAYYLYKIITISFPTTVNVEKQILYEDELFSYLIALDDIESFKKLALYAENERDIKRFLNYFISHQGYYQAYILHIPPKYPVIGAYIPPDYVYKTHYINKTYAENEECINIYFSNFASFGDLTNKKIKCKEGIVLGHKSLYVIVDERPKNYLKALIIDLNNNNKYEDPPIDGIYTIGSFINELSPPNTYYYIQDLPEENNTYYLYVLHPLEKEIFDYFSEIKSIGKLRISPLLRFYTNSTQTFEGYDALLLLKKLPPHDPINDMLWKKYVNYYKEGGNILVVAPIKNSFRLNVFGIYNQMDAGYYIKVPTKEIVFEKELEGSLDKLYLVNTLLHDLRNLNLEYKTFPLSYLSSSCNYNNLAYPAYRAFYINHSASNYTAIIGKSGNTYAIYIDKDGDCNFTDEKEILETKPFLLNHTYYRFTKYDESRNEVILNYINGSVVYAIPLPSEYLLYPPKLKESLLLEYHYSEIALNNSYNIGDIIKFPLTPLNPNTWKATIFIDKPYNVYIFKNPDGNESLYFENNPAQKYLKEQFLPIESEIYQWTTQFNNTELLLKLIYRPPLPAVIRIGNSKGGDIEVINLDLTGKSYKEYYNLLLSLIIDEMRDNEIEVNNAKTLREASRWVLYSYKLEDRNQITLKVRRYL